MFLARHVYPESSNSLCKAYLDATRKPHGYLLLDLSHHTDDRLRFRTEIFPTEQTRVYSPVDDDETCKIELSHSSRTQVNPLKIA